VEASPCTDAGKAYAQQQAAQQATEARYRKALAAKKLAPVSLKVISLATRGDRDSLPAGFKPFQLEQVDSGGTKVRVITDVQGSCGGPAALLVQRGSKIFRVERKPRLRHVKIETCTCAYAVRGGCGLRATARPVGHVIPTGTIWGGTVTIEYVEDSFEFTHAGSCPPPQAVP